VHYAGRVFDKREVKALVGSALDFWLTLGEKAVLFEKAFSNYTGLKHILVSNSGSSSNLLAVSALCSQRFKDRLRPGDEVITTAVNFPTTVAPLVQNGLIPVFVDVKPGTYNINTELIEKSLSPRTRAICIAHTLGNPVAMNEILRLKKKYGLFVIEDNCDAMDSLYDGKLTGTFGDISTFSFYAAHHITMGEGGAAGTNHYEIFRNMLSIRDWGRDCWCPTGEKRHAGKCGQRFKWNFPGLPDGYDHKYIYTNIGYNLKPLDLQCAIGIEQLKKLPSFSRKRKKNFQALWEIFGNYPKYFILPQKEKESDPSWFAFPLTIRENPGFNKRDFVSFLEENLIETRSIFAGNILRHPAYKDIPCRVPFGLEQSDKVLKNSFFLGVYPGITGEQTAYIGSVVKKFFAKHSGR
jgi:CDP-4-dehydro-6-deoxyglucose reductase, E1